jgi:ribose transport system permease protein
MSEEVTKMTKQPLAARVVTEPVAESRPAASVTAPKPGRLGAMLRAQVFRFGMVWILIALAIVSDILYPGFFAASNLNNVIGEIAPVGIVGIGMTFVIIAGGFDLSVGAMFACAAVVYALLGNHMPLGYAFVLTMGTGLIAGAINGLVITVVRVNPFIATLATASLFSGAAFLLSHSNPIVPTAANFTTLGIGKWGGIWISSFILVVIFALGALVLSRTTYGRSVFVLGGNREAARLSGLRTGWITMSTFMISGVCAAIAGMITASQTDVASADFGTTITLDSIAIVIVGGTSLMGGEGAMWRTGIGILIWGTITNLFTSLALSQETQLLMQGGILLIAVGLDSFAQRSRG